MSEDPRTPGEGNHSEFSALGLKFSGKGNSSLRENGLGQYFPPTQGDVEGRVGKWGSVQLLTGTREFRWWNPLAGCLSVAQVLFPYQPRRLGLNVEIEFMDLVSWWGEQQEGRLLLLPHAPWP